MQSLEAGYSTISSAKPEYISGGEASKEQVALSSYCSVLDDHVEVGDSPLDSEHKIRKQTCSFEQKSEEALHSSKASNNLDHTSNNHHSSYSSSPFRSALNTSCKHEPKCCFDPSVRTRTPSSCLPPIGAKDAQLTAMLLLVSFMLAVLALPQYIRYTAYMVVDFTTSPQAFATFHLLYHITNKLYFTNNAVNFFLYCLGGCRFRRDVCRIFNGCCCHKK